MLKEDAWIIFSNTGNLDAYLYLREIEQNNNDETESSNKDSENMDNLALR